MEEHVQATQRRPEEPGGWHADLRITGDNRNVHHQGDFEPTAECIAADLPHGDLGKEHEVVVEAERLTVHREPTPLAGAAFRFWTASLAVPAVGVVHVRPGAEHPVEIGRASC